MRSNSISVTKCTVFRADRLNYFFVGRPAYKKTGENPKYWQLPMCFVFEYRAPITGLKRIFPFDTGAFFRSDLMPNYLKMMDHKEFEVSAEPDAAAKLIGAFFGDRERYFELRPKTKDELVAEFALDALDEEILALHALASEPIRSLDDRKFAIEIQTTSDMPLIKNRLLAVICPRAYYDNVRFRKHVENVWGAQPIGYPLYPLNIEQYYSLIYERVENLYRQLKVLP